jgi:hypothetical protein
MPVTITPKTGGHDISASIPAALGAREQMLRRTLTFKSCSTRHPEAFREWHCVLDVHRQSTIEAEAFLSTKGL